MTDYRSYQIGDVLVTQGPSWVVTRFPDGAEVHAHPDGSEFQDAAARSLGYSDTAGLNRDHDVAHTLISLAMGDAHSHTLRGVAVGSYAPPARVALEEGLAMLLQRVSQVGIAGVLEDYAV